MSTIGNNIAQMPKEAKSNISLIGATGDKYAYQYLSAHKDADGFADAFKQLDTFSKNTGDKIVIKTLSSGGSVISKVSKNGAEEILGAHGSDIVKSLQSAAEKLNLGNILKAVKKA